MILFLEDWKLHPRAILDMQTKNTSFIEMAYKLKGVVKNHHFMLALHNPDLLGVDPHSEDLSPEMKAAILIECRQNFWYIVRNVLRAPAQSGDFGSPILANRANLALWWLFFNHITTTLTQPRQTGKSFSTDALMVALKGFICRNTKINLLTKDDGLRTENLIRLKDIYSELPPYLNFKTSEDTNSNEAITINALGNRYNGRVPSASVVGANRVGRGVSTGILQIDEAPFQPNIDIAMEAITGAMGAVIEAAQRNNEPYGLILTTTAGKLDDKSGRYIHEYVSDSAPWTDLFYDAQNQQDLYQMVRGYSKKGYLRVYAAFNHRQLGKTDEWLKSQLERNNSSPDAANRDYFNVWTSGNSGNPISSDILNIISKSIIPETCTKVMGVGKYFIRWYIPESDIDHYLSTNVCILSLDSSDAVGNDGIGLLLTDTRTGATIAATDIYLTNLHSFAQFIGEFMVRYQTTILMPERRSSAVAIIDYLLLYFPEMGVDPFTRIFNWAVNDPLEYPLLYEEIKKPLRRRGADVYIKAKQAKVFGFSTSGSGQTSRDSLYSTTLMSSLKRCANKIFDRKLAEQFLALTTRNNRIDHSTSGHDDLIIPFLMTHWLLTNGKNLSHYGIDITNLLIDEREKVKVDPQEMLFNREQNEIRHRLSELYEALQEERDAMVVARLESQFRALSARIVLHDNETLSLDAVLQDLQKKRKLKRFMAA